MKIIVLGASGQIGSVVYKGLRSFHDVVGTSRKHSNELIEFDPFEDDWTRLGKADVLINCVGQIEANRSSFYHIHVALTERILAHRAELGNPRIVQISALGASPNHGVEFLRTKGVADNLLLQHPNTAIIRPSIVCTHRTMLVKKMIMLSNLSRFSFGVVPVPKGFLKTRIQPIMPQDLVDVVHQVCIDRQVKLLDAVGPEAISFHEIIQILERSRAQELRIIKISKRLTDLVAEGIVSRMLPGIINAQQYQLLFQDNIASVQGCQQLLNRAPLSTRVFFSDEFAG